MVGPLDEHGLLEVLERRLDWADGKDKSRFRGSDVQGALRRLMRATGNPHVLLRWVQAFLRSRQWPPVDETSWCADTALLDVTRRAAIVAGIEDDLLVRLAFIVDRCLPKGRNEAQKADLQRGRLKTDTCDDGKAITDDEFESLLRAGLLIPKDKFRPEAGYRMDPLLDLLRPSVAARLREA